MKKVYIFDLVLWAVLLATLFQIGKLAGYALAWLAHHWAHPGLHSAHVFSRFFD